MFLAWNALYTIWSDHGFGILASALATQRDWISRRRGQPAVGRALWRSAAGHYDLLKLAGVAVTGGLKEQCEARENVWLLNQAIVG